MNETESAVGVLFSMADDEWDEQDGQLLAMSYVDAASFEALYGYEVGE